jgi:hypothetical protein
MFSYFLTKPFLAARNPKKVFQERSSASGYNIEPSKGFAKPFQGILENKFFSE